MLSIVIMDLTTYHLANLDSRQIYPPQCEKVLKRVGNNSQEG